MNQTVLLSRDGHVATVTLNRPDKRNSFDDVLIRQLHATVSELENDKNIRAVILTGSGSTFSAGADLAHMRKQGTMTEQENYEDALRFAQCLQALNSLDKPLVAKVNGSAYGGGIGLIACADIAVGVSNAKFALTEVRLGIVPAVISPYVVRAIGERQARHWFLAGHPITAVQAESIGLLHRVVDPQELDSAVAEVVDQLRAGSPAAIRAAKKLVRDVDGWAPSEYPHETAALLAKLRSSSEGREGLTAFLESRQPRWQTD